MDLDSSSKKTLAKKSAISTSSSFSSQASTSKSSEPVEVTTATTSTKGSSATLPMVSPGLISILDQGRPSAEAFNAICDAISETRTAFWSAIYRDPDSVDSLSSTVNALGRQVTSSINELVLLHYRQKKGWKKLMKKMKKKKTKRGILKPSKIILQYKRMKKAIQKLKSKSKGKLTENTVDDLLSPSTHYRMLFSRRAPLFELDDDQKPHFEQEFQIIEEQERRFYNSLHDAAICKNVINSEKHEESEETFGTSIYKLPESLQEVITIDTNEIISDNWLLKLSPRTDDTMSVDVLLEKYVEYCRKAPASFGLVVRDEEQLQLHIEGLRYAFNQFLPNCLLYDFERVQLYEMLAEQFDIDAQIAETSQATDTGPPLTTDPIKVDVDFSLIYPPVVLLRLFALFPRLISSIEDVGGQPLEIILFWRELIDYMADNCELFFASDDYMRPEFGYAEKARCAIFKTGQYID
ncbi:Mortality factor 4-like protein 1 [Tyrophagus putrescentiae]|nr:Mortality factor 4-like protein 1 [Tyrophagus putrescentiae]